MKKRISKKKGIILIVISLLIITISLTYAFMGSNIGIGSKTDINLNSYDVDRFTFSKGSDISISATTANFSSGASNIASSTTATASLKANSDNNSANKTYNLYLNIDNNNFVYSSASTPELLLTITDPSGNAVTSLTNLSYVTSSGVSGFDITTKTGLIKIADNYQISSSSSTSATTQTWNITITLLALTIDQSPNEGKILSADVIIQKDNYLPSDYTKLTYLQSSGTQYIDTNYIMQSGTEKVYIDFEKTDVSGYTSLCGSEYPSGSARAFSLILHGASTSSIYCGIGATIGLATAVNTRYQTTMLATGGNITGTHYDVTNNSSSSISTTYSTTNGLFSSIPYSIALFANHTSSGVSQYVSAKIYNFKLWDNNVLVRNFMPVLNEDNIPGMYDDVNGIFYPNAGSGNFSYKVSLPTGYTYLSYLAGSGTQYIDTGYQLTSNVEKIFIDFEKTDVSSSNSLFGSEYPSSNRAFTIILYGKNSLNLYCGTGSNATLEANVDTRYQTKILAQNQVITGFHKNYSSGSSININATYAITNGNLSSIPYNIYLFANHTNSGVSQIVSAKIYSFKIWDNNLLVRNFIPALNSNSVAGMYDLVNGVFYPNAGSGTFSY